MKEANHHIAGALRSDESRSAVVERFLSADPNSRYVFGTGRYSQAAAGAVPVAGFIDDFRGGDVLQGRPVLVGDEVPAESWVVNGSSDRPDSVSRRIRGLRLCEVDYLSLRRFGGFDLPYPMFGASPRGELTANHDWYAALIGRLVDRESRIVLRDVLSARWHEDLTFLAGYGNPAQEQYFEPFVGLREHGEHFVDVGSYDGATSLGFADRAPGYARITALEPHPDLAVEVGRALSELRDADVHVVGAGSRPGQLRFRSAGSASAVAEDGELEIRIECLDDLVAGAPTFLKMDIEGAELSALRGATALIRAHRPVLAICVYHRVDDLRTIPGFIDELDLGYRYYLRHYTEGIAETVFYAVPPERAG